MNIQEALVYGRSQLTPTSPTPQLDARLLLEHLLDLARGAGVEGVYLEVRPSNRDALALYHGAGFEVIGRRRAYYRAVGGAEDAVVLVRRLRRQR